MRITTNRLAAIFAVASLSMACGPQDQASEATTNPAPSADPTASASEALRGTIGPQGGELTGAPGTTFEGVHLVVPPGALAVDTELQITPSNDATPLPPAALRCGPMFDIGPDDLQLAVPATLTLPFDETIVTDHSRFDDEVKVWVKEANKFVQRKQIDSAEARVTIALPQLTHVAAGVNPPKPADIVHFNLAPNPKTVRCLAEYPDDPYRAPKAEVTVVRGELNDSLYLTASNIKPGLKFDMFTVERSPLKADKTPDPSFTNFGLAWYQSDVDARDDGRARVTIRTILLDQIFGFDPAVSLVPTSTLHVGFWFNDPNDAAACGFNPAAPTPFNGDHKAGPLAMISLPDATTNLGPLCTNPDTSTTPAHCSP